MWIHSFDKFSSCESSQLSIIVQDSFHNIPELNILAPCQWGSYPESHPHKLMINYSMIIGSLVPMDLKMAQELARKQIQWKLQL